MSSVAVLMLATPLFGLSLQSPWENDLSSAAQVAAAVDVSSAAAVSAAGGAGEDDAALSYTELLKQRNSLAGFHRPLGIATWGAMTATLVLGTIQYYNLYGFFSPLEDTPCVKGTAVFGQSQCFGTPWPHAVAAGATSVLYAGTFSLALLMPDPDNLSEGPGEFAATLRLHKLLRWVHFSGMVLQVLLGAVIANSETFGINRSENYGTLQALATVHLASGLVTYGALTWAGALMTF